MGQIKINKSDLMEIVSKIYRQIFPSNRTYWRKYIDYVLNHSQTFKPIKWVFSSFVYGLLFVLLIITFPVTRLELKIRAKIIKKQLKK